MNNRLFTTKVNLTKKMSESRSLFTVLCKVRPGRLLLTVCLPIALHLFSTMARRRISLISEEPFNWTSVGIMGSKSKWTQIGQRVNELSGRWNKNRLYLNSSGTLSLQLRLKSASTQKRGSEKPPLSRWAWAKSELGFFFSSAEPTTALIYIQTGTVQAGAGQAVGCLQQLEGRKQWGIVCW